MIERAEVQSDREYAASRGDQHHRNLERDTKSHRLRLMAHASRRRLRRLLSMR